MKWGILMGEKSKKMKGAFDMHMNHRDMLKGIGIGLVVGGAVSIALSSGRRKRKKCKGHTIKAIGEVVDNVTDMIGL